MQCYEARARKGLNLRRQRDKFWSGCDPSWEPKSKRQIRGWASFVLARHQVARQSRRHEQTMGIILLRSMISGARAVYDSLMTISKHHAFKNVQIPIPDARFFNATLNLFSRQPDMYARGARSTRSHWRRRLQQANMHYVQQGKVSKHWTPFLQEVAEAMVDAGYSVPPALRHLLVGRWTPGTLQLNDRQELERRPFAFPIIRPNAFRAHAIPTYKTRGLPVRRWPLSRTRTSKSVK